MGKKVKIPIKGSRTDSEPLEEAVSMPEEAVADEGIQMSGIFADDESSEEVAEPRLDSEFADRDVDFSGFESPAESPTMADSSDEVAKLQLELSELQQRYLRSLADLDNFRKRAQKEKSDLLKYQGEKILADIVEVLDNLELALQHKDAEIENLRTGIEMIHQQFIDVLGRWGVRAESSLGSPFDPNRQNAINKVPTADVAPGSVMAELKKAYFYKDKLIRVAEVVVAEAIENTENDGDSPT